MVVRIGAGGYRLYTPSGTGYVSQTGDTSLLSNSGDGYLLTLKHGTVYRFDANGKIRSVSDAYGNQISYGYTDGDLTSVGDQWGRTVSLAYDTGVTPHRLTGVREPRQTGFEYGFSYDGAGFLYRVSLPAVDGGSKPYWEYTYYPAGQLKTKQDPRGNRSQYEYDASGRLTRAIDPEGSGDPAGHTRGYSYEPAPGAVTTNVFTEKDSGQWQYLFDTATGLVKEKRSPDGTATGFTYTATGQLLSVTRPGTATARVSTFYGYDANGNRTTESQPVEGIDPATVSDPTTDSRTPTSFGYDMNGRILTATNGAIGYTFAYHDAASGYRGRLKSVTDSAGRQVFYDRYDKLGQRTKVTILKGAGADERVLDYAYDGANRLQSITSSAGAFTYGYDPAGRRTTLAYPNGVTATFGHDDLNRLTGVSHVKGAATVTFATYTGFDKVGNRTGKTTPGGSESYEYDNVYRLKKSVTPAGTENYGYDAVGNRTSGPGAKDTAYAFDAANRMTHGRQYGYTYDDAGNQTARTLAPAPERGWTMAWDAESRLKRMERVRRNDEGEIVESRTIDFSYDPFGRRIGKQLSTLRKGVTTTRSWSYLYDGDDIVLEVYTNEAGVSEKSYFTHGPGIDEHLALERGGNYYYYHQDGLNSVTAITDASGAVVQSYSYDSFGAPKQTTGFRNTFLFTGRELDRETGLYYYRLRYYDWMDGRFISKDPISFAGGDVNLYGYVQNNPINFVDPDGLEIKFPLKYKTIKV